MRCPFSLHRLMERPPKIRVRGRGGAHQGSAVPDGQRRMEDGICIWKILISKISKVRWFLETLVL